MACSSSEAKISPKSPALSCQQRFGWIFGEPLELLPKKKPTEFDIVRYWMFVYDNMSKSSSKDLKVSSETKKNVISSVVKSLSEHWKIQGFGVELRTTLAIIKKLKKVFNCLQSFQIIFNFIFKNV